MVHQAIRIPTVCLGAVLEEDSLVAVAALVAVTVVPVVDHLEVFQEVDHTTVIYLLVEVLLEVQVVDHPVVDRLVVAMAATTKDSHILCQYPTFRKSNSIRTRFPNSSMSLDGIHLTKSSKRTWLLPDLVSSH